MTVEMILSTLNAYKRYLSVNQSDDISIKRVDVNADFLLITCVGHMFETWIQKVYVKDYQLHIENEDGESLFEFADEYEWSLDDVMFMKFGTKITN